MSKEQEPLVDDATIYCASLAMTGQFTPCQAYTRGAEEVRAHYESARSEDTDLIKDMLPYMQHHDDCKMWKDWDRYGAVHDCDCGVDMILQRINERSK